MSAVPTLTADELLDLLERGVAGEELGDPTSADPPVVMVRGPSSPSRVARAAELSRSLPCVLIGQVDDHAIAPIVDAFVTDAQRRAVIEQAAATPLAAVTLAIVLRASQQLDVASALAAESAAYSMLLAGPEFAAWRAGRPRARPRDEGPPLQLRRDAERTLEITLDRPHVHNAWSTSMRDAMAEALQLAAADATIEHVVVRGAGRSFCSGGDLDEFGSAPDPVTAHTVRLLRSPAGLMSLVADRVTCHLHGACFGAGIELPAFGRQIVADPDTVIALPELSMGLIPGAGGTVSLPRRIGRHRTALLGLSGMRLDAETAMQWGLVDRLL